ncbi:hypothetical protein [Methanomassiliicoccus luminyensis]|uniref:hypothetical protein n=1 Tax=Methanomassiliicoccus luminyensis TaxID=1080712 RepID=UPI0012DE751D|nr:hypothetical protein [Methanomassiliicoccus luminyensis]
MARKKSESKDNTDKKCGDCSHCRTIVCDSCLNMDKFDALKKGEISSITEIINGNGR